MTKAPESILVATIVQAIKEVYPNALTKKDHGSIYTATGWPDLTVIIDGRAYFLEVKRQRNGESIERARGRVSAMQRLTIEKLRNAGAVADCVTSSAEAIAVISESKTFL